MRAWTSSRGASGRPTAGSTTARGPRNSAGLRQLLSPESPRSRSRRASRACSTPWRSPASGRPTCPACCGRTSARPSSCCWRKCRRRTGRTRTSSARWSGTTADRPLTDAEAHEALLQATVRVVMRLVVCLFAESRQLLPVNDPIYAQAYGVRSLYELLEEAVRNEGGAHAPVQPPHGLAPADGPVPADPRRLGPRCVPAAGLRRRPCSGPATTDERRSRRSGLAHPRTRRPGRRRHDPRRPPQAAAGAAAGDPGAAEDVRGRAGRLHRPPHRVHRPDLRGPARLPAQADGRARSARRSSSTSAASRSCRWPGWRRCWPTTRRA